MNCLRKKTPRSYSVQRREERLQFTLAPTSLCSKHVSINEGSTETEKQFKLTLTHRRLVGAYVCKTVTHISQLIIH